MNNAIVYEGKTLSQWARELGIHRTTINKRAAARGSIGSALEMGPHNRPSVKHEGKSATDWARELGISKQAMHHRIARHGSLEAAVALGGRNKPWRKAKAEP